MVGQPSRQASNTLLPGANPSCRTPRRTTAPPERSVSSTCDGRSCLNSPNSGRNVCTSRRGGSISSTMCSSVNSPPFTYRMALPTDQSDSIRVPDQ